jgi:hypothetical protein
MTFQETSDRIPIGTNVKIVDDVDKPNSQLLGLTGTVTGHKQNKFREGGFIPVVQLEDGRTISGWSLWYAIVHVQKGTEK